MCVYGTLAGGALTADAFHISAPEPSGEQAARSIKLALERSAAAAGSLSAMVCLLAMRDSVIPPTINLERADPDCDLDFVPLRARRERVQTALVNAFGFGGQNCVVVLRSP